MIYLFRDKWHEVPVYAQYPMCRLVKVEYTILLAPVTSRDERVIERSWRKVWKFIGAEGLAGTWQKVRSKQEQSQLNGDFHVVLALGTEFSDTQVDASDEHSKTLLLCLGTRHPRAAEVMLFRQELTAQLATKPSAEESLGVVEEIVDSFQTGELALWNEIGGYNFYSDLTPPAVAQQFVCAVAKRLNNQSTTNQSNDNQQRTAQMTRINLNSHQVIYPSALNIAQMSAKRSLQVGVPVKRQSGSVRGSAPRVVVVAAGDYVRTTIAPSLKRSGVVLHTIVDLEPYRAEFMRDKCGFRFAITDWREAVAQADTDVVIVASYHDSHAVIAAEALRQGKRTFVEKPPVVTGEDLSLLLEAAARPGLFLEVGYNRRYARFSRQAKELIESARGPTTMMCVVKEVEIPDGHWYRWPKQGTRITGNLCHWIDLGIYLIGSNLRAVEMTLTAPADAQHADEERGLNILFEDNSTLTIIATARGDATMGVGEFIEVRRADLTVRIDDFRCLTATRSGRMLKRAAGKRDKGHSAMYCETMERIKNNKAARYTLTELRRSALLTITATEMAQSDVRHLRIDI